MEYKLIDCGHFKKLEEVGPFRFVRPSPQAVWAPRLGKQDWADFDAEYIRKSDGKGFWKYKNKDLPEDWEIKFEHIKMKMKRTSFGHIGAFIEQKDNWVEFHNILKQRNPEAPFKVLNLFAYTGGATIACAINGVECVHLDASKTSNSWARENAQINDLEEAPIKWITDDVKTFVQREVRRGNKYQAIIIDPPTYGRGSKNQVWKIEEDMVPLLENLKQLCAEDLSFFSLSSHSPGYTPVALENLLSNIFKDNPGSINSREMVVNFEFGQLPSGATALYTPN